MKSRFWNYFLIFGAFLMLTLSCGKDDDDIYKKDSGTFTDFRDDHVYKWVKIGDQIWMAENLAYGMYGSLIYNNDVNNLISYGRLYSASMAKEVCPAGWHLPTDEEWQQLEIAIGINPYEVGEDGSRGTNEGTKLKAISGWNNNSNGTDDFGFSALPGGFCGYRGVFYNIGFESYWWSATESNDGHVYCRILSDDTAVLRTKNFYPGYQMSVRCVKD